LSRPLQDTAQPSRLESSSQRIWCFTQLGIFVLPLSTFLGSVILLLTSLFIWSKHFSSIVRKPSNLGFIVLGALLLVASSTAFQPFDALLGLFNFLPFFLLFAAVSWLVQTPAQLRRLAWLMVLTSVPVVLIGLGQLFLSWAGHVTFLWLVIDWKIYPTGNPPGRMASVFDYANVLANYLVITFILALGLWISAYPWRKERDEIRKPDELPHPYTRRSLQPGFDRWFFLSGIVLLNGIGLILTNSRSAWAIAVLACLAYAVYLGWRWLLVLVSGIAALVLGAAFAPNPIRQGLRTIVPAFFWARLTDELYPNRPLPLLRATQWQFAWDLAQQRPLTGWGLRNFTPLYQAKMQFWLGHPHNLLLMSLAETGFPATMLLFGLVGWMVVRGIWWLRRWGGAVEFGDRSALFSYLVAFLGCTLFNMFDITFFDARMNALGWFLLAAICGVGASKPGGKLQTDGSSGD
jgi:O-antigen ligase